MSFPYLDLAIGMSFIFLLLALTCTTINETIAGIINSRGKTLEKGVAELLQDRRLKDLVYAHPLIKGIQPGSSGGKGRSPSYIASNKFALALMDILTGPAPASSHDALCQGVAKLADSPTKTVLTAVLNNPKYATDQERLEAWYEQGMGRVSGWYKRTTQVRIYVLAILITLLMNADALKILRTLWSNPTMSAVMIESAKERLQKGRPDADMPMVNYDNPDDPTASTPTQIPERDIVSEGEKKLLGQVSGWQGDWYNDWPGHETRGFGSWLFYLLKTHLLGWIITIFALSLGAPFWFDTLNKFMNVRNAGKPPEKSSEKPPTHTQSQTPTQPPAPAQPAEGGA